MRSKNSKAITKDESAYLHWVKSQPCIVCNEPGPSDAHHIEQGRHYTTLPLCKGCHQGSHNGIHEQHRLWDVLKMTELRALNELIRRLASVANLET